MTENDKKYGYASIVKVVGIRQEENMLIVQYMNGNKRGLTVPREEISNYKELDLFAVIDHPLTGMPVRIIKGDASWWLDSVVVGWAEYIDNERIIVKTNGNLFHLNKSDVDVNIGDLVMYNLVDGEILQVMPKDQLADMDKELPSDEKNEYLVDVQKLDLTFEDFGGYPAIVKRARELIETQLRKREKLREIGAKPVKGVLFTGLPGTGKTHLARIIAKECGANFYHIDGPSIVGKYFGDSEKALRGIFAHARQSGKPSIIFFDEIDSIAANRAENTHEASNMLVTQFLTLMDGFNKEDDNIVVLATTNREAALDPALRRPGRFDWTIEFTVPTFEDRRSILILQAKRYKCVDEISPEFLEEVANETKNWLPVDLGALWDEAALIAVGEGRNKIHVEDMVIAFEQIDSRVRNKK
jgi:microtubule-severing ATPase